MANHCNGKLDYSMKLPTIKFTKLFINGEFVDSVSGTFRFALPPLYLSLSLFLSRTIHIGSTNRETHARKEARLVLCALFNLLLWSSSFSLGWILLLWSVLHGQYCFVDLINLDLLSVKYKSPISSAMGLDCCLLGLVVLDYC